MVHANGLLNECKGGMLTWPPACPRPGWRRRGDGPPGSPAHSPQETWGRGQDTAESVNRDTLTTWRYNGNHTTEQPLISSTGKETIMRDVTIVISVHAPHGNKTWYNSLNMKNHFFLVLAVENTALEYITSSLHQCNLISLSQCE